MPIIACPTCGASTRVPPERLGQAIDCPRCTARFTALVEREPWTRILHRRHSAGFWIGVILLATAVFLGALVFGAVGQQQGDIYAALFGRDSTLLARLAFFGAVAAGLVGILFLRRWYRARSRWPRR